MYVITSDQRDSRRGADLVPHALEIVNRVSGGHLVLPAERTAGDEIQALTARPDIALALVLALTRDGSWSVGVGVGAVEEPLPAETRAARGTAFVHARDAVERAKTAPVRIAVSGDDDLAAQDAEALLRLIVELRDRRTPQGWEVADLLADGRTQKRVAETLGIGESAVSLRAKAAGLRVEENAIPALARVLARLDA